MLKTCVVVASALILSACGGGGSSSGPGDSSSATVGTGATGSSDPASGTTSAAIATSCSSQIDQLTREEGPAEEVNKYDDPADHDFHEYSYRYWSKGFQRKFVWSKTTSCQVSSSTFTPVGNTSATTGSSSSTTGETGGASAATGTFTINAKLNGTAVSSFTLNAGENKVLGITTGDDVEIDSSVAAVLAAKNTGAASIDVISSTSTIYKAKFTTADHTIAKLVFASASDPSKTAAITLTISGKSSNFNAVRPAVGDAFTYTENDKTLDGTPVTFPNITHRVSSVDTGTGAWKEQYLNLSNVVLSNVDLNAQGNRTGYQATAADPGGCKDARYEPEEKLLVFPLAVNNSYSGSWTARCLPYDSQNEALTATVMGYEQISTAAGVFRALRIQQVTDVSNSTNTALPQGAYQQKVTYWFDPILGRTVKYTGVRTYPGVVPANPSMFLSETSGELIKALKN